MDLCINVHKLVPNSVGILGKPCMSFITNIKPVTQSCTFRLIFPLIFSHLFVKINFDIRYFFMFDIG